ncbi:MAG: isoleucine--tRNA ligase [Micavibrio sp.]|nr:MAG: isoleucine--tRNA ligase [Micavibrio sp.]
MSEQEPDYGHTIHLPKTEFSRRGGLAQKEPVIVKRWEEIDLYKKQREMSKGRTKKILHMGPPFANGHIHMGHALSTVLKDIVVRSWQMLGYDAPLVPGFDCHGLPIEWKIEEKYRAEGKRKEDVPPEDFRQECRDFAQHWLTIQTKEFKRLGIWGDWDNPYNTMDKRSEALIAREIHKFLKNSSLYQGSKPVMWSVTEKTALAEAEVEYRDHTSDTVWVKFPIKSGAPEGLEDAHIVIWTTTPWTLPGNRALAYGAEIDYTGFTVDDVTEDSLAQKGDRLVVAKDLLGETLEAAGITAHTVFWNGKGTDFADVVCRHTLHAKGYDFDVPVLEADFVTIEQGTGFVHIAPGHGEDDYKLGIKNGIEVPHTVNADGTYTDTVPLFAGAPVYLEDGRKGPANKLVMAAIAEEGNLVAKGQLRHSYPHSWRSKAPLIFRNTPQWFINLDSTKDGEDRTLREKALAEIAKTRWVPERGENRIASMVETRGDWCISRQRAWGVPIAIFVNKTTGETLTDDAVLDRIISVFEQEGSDAWFTRDPQDFLGNGYSKDEWEPVTDIIDVWFESGSTQSFVLKERDDQTWPADLYLEGSDQHRGWFQSSLLVSCATNNTAPFKAVLTHGFILDEKGYKMSKSGGNGLSPLDLSKDIGADIVRLWVAGSDYTDDIRIGKNILQGHTDIYRRIRGTFCYLLGNLNGYKPEDAVAYEDMPELERWVLHRLCEIDGEIRRHIENFDFQRIVTLLHNFCAKDLSAFYFDISKDNLYCNPVGSVQRRAAQTVLDKVFTHLVHWIAPVLSFTAEEAWLSRIGESIDSFENSLHLREFPDIDEQWRDEALAEKWQQIQNVRRVVTGALEIKRAEKAVRSSLEAAPKIYVEDENLADMLMGVDFADICIVSDVEIVIAKVPPYAFTLDDISGIGVEFAAASGEKCARCWKYTSDIGSDSEHPAICKRCAEAVKTEKMAAA